MRILIILVILLFGWCLCKIASATSKQEAWTIGGYAKNAYKKPNMCVAQASLARKVAESRGWKVTDKYERNSRGRHKYLILEKDGVKTEILH